MTKKAYKTTTALSRGGVLGQIFDQIMADLRRLAAERQQLREAQARQDAVTTASIPMFFGF